MPRFEERYANNDAPWDIGRPQDEIVRLAEEGQIAGPVLDVGCGTGENALYLASRGHEAWGIDYEEIAIERARKKSQDRGIAVEFITMSALEMETLGRTFDTVIDSGLYHSFSDEEKPTFVTSLASILKPGGRYFVLCFSELETREGGPKRVTQDEIRQMFSDGWRVDSIEATHFAANLPGGEQRCAWLASLTRE